MSSQEYKVIYAKQHGFTLIEVLIAIAITAAVMVAVSATFITTLRSHREVESLTESTEAGSRILNLLERDLRGLWIYNIKNNEILKGRNLDLNGQPADRIDFITSTDSVSTIQNVAETPAHSSVCEVGYWLRPNPKDPLLMELWRREDPMVDDELLLDGRFQLVHDRLRSFNITYYKTLGHNAEEIEEWDSSEKDELPRVLKIEFTIERKLASSNEVTHSEVDDFEDNNKKYTHYIVLEKEYMDILKPKVAMIPVFPGPPGSGDAGGSGSAGGGEDGGVKGPAGPGRGSKGGGGALDPIEAGEGGKRDGNRGSGRVVERFGPSMPRGFPPGGGQGNIDINSLFRMFGGGGGGGGNPFGGGKR